MIEKKSLKLLTLSACQITRPNRKADNMAKATIKKTAVTHKGPKAALILASVEFVEIAGFAN